MNNKEQSTEKKVFVAPALEYHGDVAVITCASGPVEGEPCSDAWTISGTWQWNGQELVCWD